MHISKTVEMTIAEQEEVDSVLGTIVQSDDEEDDGEDDDGEEDDGNSDDAENVGATYVVDPDTGELKDATTGEPAEIDNSLGDEDTVIDIGDSEVIVTQE
jgi:hypothetical protein